LCKWGAMSDFHPQSAFGLPSFIGVSASGK
jgi:hypothetical protein